MSESVSWLLIVSSQSKKRTSFGGGGGGISYQLFKISLFSLSPFPHLQRVSKPQPLSPSLQLDLLPAAPNKGGMKKQRIQSFHQSSGPCFHLHRLCEIALFSSSFLFIISIIIFLLPIIFLLFFFLAEATLTTCGFVRLLPSLNNQIHASWPSAPLPHGPTSHS